MRLLLVDSSVWIDHLRKQGTELSAALEAGIVLSHPMVVGEIAMGSLRDRRTVLEALGHLPQARVANHDEVLDLVDRRAVFGRGLGYIDAHLLASTLLTFDAALWTKDRQLASAATEFGIGAAIKV